MIAERRVSKIWRGSESTSGKKGWKAGNYRYIWTDINKKNEGWSFHNITHKALENLMLV